MLPVWYHSTIGNAAVCLFRSVWQQASIAAVQQDWMHSVLLAWSRLVKRPSPWPSSWPSSLEDDIGVVLTNGSLMHEPRRLQGVSHAFADTADYVTPQAHSAMPAFVYRHSAWRASHAQRTAEALLSCHWRFILSLPDDAVITQVGCRQHNFAIALALHTAMTRLAGSLLVCAACLLLCAGLVEGSVLGRIKKVGKGIKQGRKGGAAGAAAGADSSPLLEFKALEADTCEVSAGIFRHWL